ncbi:MAG: class I SAM-dependent methyltransferase [Balneolales bacterium]|nr:class I SAM-dependent methyltransferase [Balneolales bacterium]
MMSIKTAPDPQRCPLSGDTDIIKKLTTSDYAHSNESFDIWANERLNYRFTWPQPSPAEIGFYYQFDSYLSHQTEQTTALFGLYKQLRDLQLKWKLFLCKKYGSGKTPESLLDFGCGTGEFAAYCQNRGTSFVAGIEPQRDALEYCNKTQSVKAWSTLEELEPDLKFSAITAWHVIEHLHEPVSTVATLAGKLCKNGVLIVAVPNFTSTDAIDYDSFWAGWDVPRHLHHFSPQAIQYLADKTDMEICGMHRMLLDAFYVSLLSEAYKGNEGLPKVIKSILSGLKSGIISLYHLNKSSSITYVLKKRS